MNDNLQAPMPTDHNTRRAVLLEILLIYGTFFALAAWNWWPA